VIADPVAFRIALKSFAVPRRRSMSRPWKAPVEPGRKRGILLGEMDEIRGSVSALSPRTPLVAAFVPGAGNLLA